MEPSSTFEVSSVVLVDFLAQQGIIPEHLRQRVALRGSDQARDTLRELICSEEVDPDKLAEALGEFGNVPYISLRTMPRVAPEIIGLLPPEVIGERGVLPLGFDERNVLFVGCLYPLDRDAHRLVSFFSAARVEPVVICATDMAWTLDRVFGSAWHKTWAELLGRHRKNLLAIRAEESRDESGNPQESVKDDSAENEVHGRLKRAIERGLTRAFVPLRKRDEIQAPRDLQRYFEASNREVSTPVGGQAAVEEADIQLAFRQASRPEGYDRVTSGAYATTMETGRKPRLEGFFGTVEAMLSRSRETQVIADEAFELAANSCLASARTPLFYRELVESLSAVYPISTVWFVRDQNLLLAAAESDVADLSAEIGTEFERGADGPWERVARTGLAYRGRLTKRDSVSEWLREQGAHHIWILPFYVSSRLVLMLGLGTTETRSMVLASLPSYHRLDDVLSTEYFAGAACLRSHQITADYEN